jgi:hypothetical protein
VKKTTVGNVGTNIGAILAACLIWLGIAAAIFGIVEVFHLLGIDLLKVWRLFIG